MKRECCDNNCRQGRDCPNRTVGGEEVVLKLLLILAVMLSVVVVFDSVVRAFYE